MTTYPATLGLVLAGGLARRMGGGDKALLRIGGATILERVLDRLAPQCAGIVLNANGDPARGAQGRPLACARSGEWRHPVVGLWPVALRADLRRALVEEHLHKIEIWTSRHGVAIADWPETPVDPFFHVNKHKHTAPAERIQPEKCD